MKLGLPVLMALGMPLAAHAGDRLCDGYAGLPEGSAPTAGMGWIPGGSFIMGDDEERPEERPAHRVTVEDFWIDRHEVTNAQFARFVAATGYRTVAERGFTAQERPDLPPELRAPGRYRPAARQPQELGLGASHLGFRTVLDQPLPSSAAIRRPAGATTPEAGSSASASPD